MLACRLCRVPVAAAKGCAVCDPIRANLVVVGEDDEDRPSLAGTANEMVAILRAQVKNIAAALKANPKSEREENRALKVANTLSKLLETSRKLVQDGVSAVETMSFREQAELFVGWFAGLAPAYRADVMAKFAAFEQEIARPVEVEATQGN